MDVPRGENSDLIDFAEINVVKNELQSLGMMKVELAAVVEMSKRNEEGVITYLIIITWKMKHEFFKTKTRKRL